VLHLKDSALQPNWCKRKLFPCSGMLRRPARGRPIGVAGVQFMQESSTVLLTVNIYYVLDIIRRRRCWKLKIRGG